MIIPLELQIAPFLFLHPRVPFGCTYYVGVTISLSDYEVKGDVKWKSIMGPIDRNYWIKQKQTQQFFTLCHVLFAQTWCLKDTKTQLWMLAFCAQQSLSMTSCARNGMCGKSTKYVTNGLFGAIHCKKSEQTWGPVELKFEAMYICTGTCFV